MSIPTRDLSLEIDMGFITGRFLSSIVSIFGATYIVFVLTLFHNDPTNLFIPDTGFGLTAEQLENLRERLGLNEPWWKRYTTLIGRAFRGDLGVSLARQQSVTSVLGGKVGATIQLAIGGWIFAIMLGIPAGVMAAVRRGTIWDYIARLIALVGQAAPPFVTGLVMIWVFAVFLEVLPAGQRQPEFDIRDYILPSIALGWGAAAGLMRLTRSSMLEVLDSEYIKLARAKGVTRQKVILKHALRNSLIAPVTSALILFSNWLNGALVVEIVFSWPGVGVEALQNAVTDNDFPLLLGSVFFFILVFLVFSTMADILYTIIDPRVRLQ